MRVLVTGAAGFLGFALAKRLSDDGHFVICIDNFIRGENDQAYQELSAKPNVETLDLDLTNQAGVRALPHDVDLVFHMAALNGTQNFYERPFEVMRCCTLPTIFLLERYASSKSLRRFVYAGTSEAYASTVTQFGWPVPTVEDVPLSINDPRNVRWSYGASKMHGEVAALNAAAAFGTPVSIVRYHNAYGPRMGDKHVIPDFLCRAKHGEFALFGWEDTRSFIYVEDAVEATVRIANAAACEGEIVNVGGAREIRILELAQVMMEVMGWTGEIAKHPSPVGSVKRRAPDTTKLHRLTGFEEHWTLEEGLKETGRFYVGNKTITTV